MLNSRMPQLEQVPESDLHATAANLERSLAFLVQARSSMAGTLPLAAAEAFMVDIEHHSDLVRIALTRALGILTAAIGAVRCARHPAAAGDLFNRQTAATATFRAIVMTTRALVAALEFPLGSPARGYDLVDIDAALADWLAPRSADLLEAEAREIVIEAEASALADAADTRRDAANDNYAQPESLKS